MKDISAQDIKIPLDVSKEKKKEYIDNYLSITHNTNKLFLVAGDQRVEHMITSFKGKGIDKDDLNPEHYFKIVSKSNIGAFATQIGYILNYAMDYPNIPYVVKLNSISKVLKEGYGYKFSRKWISPHEILDLRKKTKVKIYGIGYTLYIGIKEESYMLAEASQVIRESHYLGFPVILWIYPKGKAIKNETDSSLISTCTNIGGALGADFIKVNAPDEEGSNLVNLEDAVISAGRAKIIVAGGSNKKTPEYLKLTSNQLNTGISGVAVGRNVHQKSEVEGIKFCNAVYNLVVKGIKLDSVLKEYNSVSRIL